MTCLIIIKLENKGNLMNIEEIFPEGVWKGDEYVIRCPICGDSKTHNHLHINSEKGVYHCFYKGCSGKLKKLLKEYAGGADLEPRQGVVEKKQYPEVDFSTFYTIAGTEGPNDRLAFAYLRNRGLTKKDIDFYNILYAPNGRYFGRVIVPIYEEGKIVCFSARSFLPFVNPKYMFPHSGETLLTTSEAVFGYDKFAKVDAYSFDLFITEGVFDAIAVAKRLQQPSVSILSKFASDGQIAKLLRLKVVRFFVMLDSDARVDSLKVAKKLSSYGRDVRICFLEEGDPESANDDDFYNAIEKAQPFSIEVEIKEAWEDKR